VARVLGARRLSHDTDASTSNERQGEAITGWAKLKDHTVVALTNDTDVSGAVSPFDRDDLGPWLRPPRLHQWDVLVVAKLDRVSRPLVDFANLLTWCQEHGKVLVSVAEGLDFGTPTGQFIGKILILFAEWERQTMRERRADAARKLYADAGFNGGASLPWGYRAMTVGGKIELSPGSDMVALVGEIADAVIGGESVLSAADRHGMNYTTLLRRLWSPSLKGVVTLHGDVVRDADGLPKLREPVVSRRAPCAAHRPAGRPRRWRRPAPAKRCQPTSPPPRLT
jgi:DNA invertase Pin-like site-specific DNA recombinase